MQAEHPHSNLVGDRWETRGDKWETNVKSCGQSIQSSVVGDRRETKITRAEHPESSGRQMGDKRRQVRQM